MKNILKKYQNIILKKEIMNRKEFINADRVVIKLGTNTLRNDDGEVSLPRIYSYIEDIAHLVKTGKEIILVTSGAVGLGRKKINVEKSDDIVIKQACAAIGQCKLMSLYEDGFGTYNVTTAQVLLTEDDFSQRKRYLNLRNTLNKLLELNVLPIINQNDTVSTVELDEIYQDMQVCFSDNDKLSALVASEMDADLLIILSDVDGLFDSNPKDNPNANIITEVKEVTDEILKLGKEASENGRGGFRSKLEAAKQVNRFGGKVLIANGKHPSVIKEIFDGKEIGTAFLPNENGLSEKKRWIGYATNVIGKITVNTGAKSAILNNSSLLPIGIINVINDFKKGEVVSIVDEHGQEIARGMVNYNSEDCRKIIGCHSDDILKILGYKNYDAVVTRDNITIL